MALSIDVFAVINLVFIIYSILQIEWFGFKFWQDILDKIILSSNKPDYFSQVLFKMSQLT